MDYKEGANPFKVGFFFTTEFEIRLLYRKKISCHPEPNLTFYWRFNAALALKRRVKTRFKSKAREPLLCE